MGEMNKPEILAPAGSMESLRAAVAAGCDAVYIGGSRFAARAYADNLQEEEMTEAVRYCHLHGVKIYLTVNTLLKERELEEELYEYISPYYQEGLDAVIVQDVGVMRYLHQQFPDLAIHASTQMTLTMGKSARLLEQYGVNRIVPARELTLQEIARFRQDTGLEIEIFVHGALCYCYSGQCLFSSMLGGRSGNRGRCAQPCRMPYYVGEDAGTEPQRGGRDACYILSLKENCSLAYVGRLADAGVNSFKIEGRMKRPEYTAFTTAMYRKYIDLYRELGREEYERYLGVNKKQWQEDIRKLGELYNRSGFTSGYLEGNTDRQRKGEMLSILRPKHGGIRIGKVLSVDRHIFSYAPEHDLHPQDVVEIRDDRQRQIYEYTLGEEKKAGKRITARYQKGCRILPGNLIYRTKDAALLEKIRQTYIQREKKIVLQAVFTGKEDQKMTLELICRQKDGENIRIRSEGEKCQKAQNQPVTEERIKKLLCQTGDTPFLMDDLQVRLDGKLFLPVGAVKELRRQALEQLRRRLEERGSRKYSRKRKYGQRSVADGGDGETDRQSRETDGGTERTMKRIVSVLTWEQFRTAASSESVDQIYLKMDQMDDRQLREAVQEGERAGKGMYLMLPAVMRSSVYEAERKKLSGRDSLYRMGQLRGFVVRNMESFVFLRDEAQINTAAVITDSNLYVTNREAAAYWREQGCRRLTLPLELTGGELGELSDGMGRLSDDPECLLDALELEAVVYGHIPLMVSAQCVRHNTHSCRDAEAYEGNREKQEELLTIQDSKGRKFFVFNACKYCYNIIYQGEPYVLGGFPVRGKETGREVDILMEQGVCRFRYDFTVEKPQEVERILAGTLPSGHTGHFYHGVN